MLRYLTLILIILCAQISIAQNYVPVSVTGFNHDVVAEGTDKDVTATTSREMDAIDPSNYVMCTKQFAASNGMSRLAGLPNNGVVGSFAMENFARNNALYLLKGQSGTLRLAQPQMFESILLLGLATEGNANLTITLNFADGTNAVMRDHVFSDWFGGNNTVLKGFGRIKRIDASRIGLVPFEAPGDNPRMYSFEVACPGDKRLLSIGFNNVSGGSNTASNRAFIFAVAGRAPEVVPPPFVAPVVEKKDSVPLPFVVKKEAVEEIIPNKDTVTKKLTPQQVKVNAIVVKGVVLDSKTNAPIAALLDFKGTSANSNNSGAYRIEMKSGGEYNVKVEAKGYLSVLQKVIVVAGAPNQFDFKLDPVVVGTLVNLKSVLFKVSTPILLEESYPELSMVADMMKKSPTMTIDLAGHTDNVGAKSLNLKLSNDRVAAIKKYLIGQGIDGNRITGKGYGGEKPAVKGNTEEARKLNRRVEFVVTKM